MSMHHHPSRGMTHPSCTACSRGGVAMTGFSNDKPLHVEHPCPGAREGGFIEYKSVERSHDRMLSTTAIGWCRAVCGQPPYRRGEVVARFRNDFT
eukprot:6192567-Prymnesium_polylepis.1